MAYQRFRLQECLATLATPATVSEETGNPVANVATVETTADTAPVGIPDHLLTESAIALERAAARLRSLGCPADEVSSRALAIVGAELRNSPVLFSRQLDLNRCHVCGDVEKNEDFIAVLSAMPDRPHWLHPSCHGAHIGRLGERADEILRALALRRSNTLQ